MNVCVCVSEQGVGTNRMSRHNKQQTMKMFKSTAPDEPRIIIPNRFRVHQEIIHPLIMSESAILLTSTKNDTKCQLAKETDYSTLPASIPARQQHTDLKRSNHLEQETQSTKSKVARQWMHSKIHQHSTPFTDSKNGFPIHSSIRSQIL